jgi:hypothetical protein
MAAPDPISDGRDRDTDRVPVVHRTQEYAPVAVVAWFRRPPHRARATPLKPGRDRSLRPMKSVLRTSFTTCAYPSIPGGRRSRRAGDLDERVLSGEVALPGPSSRGSPGRRDTARFGTEPPPFFAVPLTHPQPKLDSSARPRPPDRLSHAERARRRCSQTCVNQHHSSRTDGDRRWSKGSSGPTRRKRNAS